VKDVLRAGTWVKLTTEGEEAFPIYVGKAGRLEGYERVGFARVLFDEPRAIVRLNASLIEARDPVIKKRRKRKLLRAAFDLIRGKP
jgi:hypothetical protein